MAANQESSTWADQWDHTPEPVSTPGRASNRLGGSTRTDRYKQKVGEGLVKTKTAASHGVQKVKEGTAVGFRWIKDKYHQTTRKH
ncbi:uncharacterized protein LOC104426300 [Eucalyptus grandis]|uniref:uncharacterized protein LOC104426300 n=1 Tax=Eucalyptus grandis TaxID=71139 RepID=UPI00192EB978|nr:uncharacterized protein LOC104426300 [Eucalyptus grandis]